MWPPMDLSIYLSPPASVAHCVTNRREHARPRGMLPEDRIAINNLIKRIESWPSAVEQLGGPSSVARPPTTSSSKLPRSTASSTSRSKRGTEQPRLSSSLRAPASRKSSMMASSLPQRPSVYGHNPAVGPDLGPGSHDISHGRFSSDVKARE